MRSGLVLQPFGQIAGVNNGPHFRIYSVSAEDLGNTDCRNAQPNMTDVLVCGEILVSEHDFYRRLMFAFD